jgi:hypothetical protein
VVKICRNNGKDVSIMPVGMGVKEWQDATRMNQLSTAWLNGGGGGCVSGGNVSRTRETSGHSLGTPRGPCRATTVLEVCISMNIQGCGQDSRKGNGYLTRASNAAA